VCWSAVAVPIEAFCYVDIYGRWLFTTPMTGAFITRGYMPAESDTGFFFFFFFDNGIDAHFFRGGELEFLCVILGWNRQERNRLMYGSRLVAAKK
jgi:hypothetical protein